MSGNGSDKSARLRQLIGETPVIPVLQITDVRHALPLAEALASGGLSVIEVTLRTEAALAAITAIARDLPEVRLGAGTVLDADGLGRAADAGASFAVSPGFTPALMHEPALPLLPGVMTPGEVMLARDYGYSLLKLFPAEQAGGIAMLRALAGPFSELSFCPTGGISEHLVATYLQQPNVRCVGGSWFAPPAVQAAGDWSLVTRRARVAAALANPA